MVDRRQLWSTYACLNTVCSSTGDELESSLVAELQSDQQIENGQELATAETNEGVDQQRRSTSSGQAILLTELHRSGASVQRAQKSSDKVFI